MNNIVKNPVIGFFFLTFWVGYIFLFSYFTSEKFGTAYGILVTVNGAAFHILAITINLGILIPRFLTLGKISQYFISLSILAIVSIVLRMNVENLLSAIYTIPADSPTRHFLFTGGSVVIFLVLFTMFNFTVDWFAQEKIRRELETQKMSAELNYLKAQINPHFFFNTLNNLYSLAIKNAPETPEVILKLSELMRYMLYESKEERVALHTELEYLKSFIDLQILRIPDTLQFQYNINGNPEGHLIEPMLMLPIVENAFKHVRKNEKGFYIDVQITIETDKIALEVANTHLPNTGSARKHSSGIGLQNVRRRLELLYPKQNTFITENTPLEYRTKLTIHDRS